MKILDLSTDCLIPYANNNRKHSEDQVTRLSTSISKFGFTQPIVIDKHRTVIIGHGRLMAAQKLKLSTVPCVQLENLSEANIRALRIIDNKLQQESEWDFVNLEIELGALHDADFDLEEFELDDLIPETIDEGFSIQENKAPKKCPHCGKEI